MSHTTQQIEQRLAELDLTLPQAASPVANYVPYVQTGNLIHISGQLSIGPDGLIMGKIGSDLNSEKGAEAARFCALNLIAQLFNALDGDLSRLRRVVRLGGFVQCNSDFTDHPKIINGASDLMVALFGDDGRHARAAVGVPSLPLGAAVEIDGLFEVKT